MFFTKTLSLILLGVAQLTNAAPIPIIITRMHTADAVTVTNTYVSNTVTVTGAPVEILISNGVTFTLTVPDATFQGTYTTTIENRDLDSVSTQATVALVATEAAVTAAVTAPATLQTAAIESDELTTTSRITLTTTITESWTLGVTNSGTSTATTQTPAVTTQTPVSTTQTPAVTTQTPAVTTQTPVATTQTPAVTTQTPTTSTAQNSPTTSSSLMLPKQIVYSPYNDDGSCKSYNTVYADLNMIKSKGINSVRIYGTDCGSIQTVEPICATLGLTINQGFYITSAGVDSIDDGVSELISWVESSSSGWALFDFITVGNEALYNNWVSGTDLINKIGSVKALLKAAGYTGKVTTSEPPQSWVDNSDLCGAVDFLGLNAHPYFDAAIDASQSGEFILSQISTVQAVCPNLSVYLAETGYPTQGDTNGLQVPSKANQRIAIAGILGAVNGDATLLTTFNDMWKSPGPYNVEQYFGAIDQY
ncbi:glycoside hydrolase family 17 protein [Babjeviella inositovora NRRL Y-12698]|uniref:Glycoside hydrolase family 17 protein n=1 Tax=Babjeviella inositovora NRRL Y-12698 TaxID=984486 RepID=A0A1E3QHD3_9ASCO|nr:glycoside hydrolase family 17 protein [Babjeviella inositovora NRRL Y-12698]ODQ77105.1 glycoside hydrolase family 17 protein [Babjeviella inositovora NRRL Y-12698]